jgi:hypothetical protein
VALGEPTATLIPLCVEGSRNIAYDWGEVADNIWLAASPRRSDLKTLWPAGRHIINHAAILTGGSLDHVSVATEASTIPLKVRTPGTQSP